MENLVYYHNKLKLFFLLSCRLYVRRKEVCVFNLIFESLLIEIFGSHSTGPNNDGRVFLCLVEAITLF